MMDELAVWYGMPVAAMMLGVPLWRSIEECRQGRLVQMRLIKWWITCSLVIFFSFFLAVSISMVEFVLSNTLISASPDIPTNCRILSKSVDLRHSKICELRDLQQMPQKVWGIHMGRKPSCYLDYYWTTILKVEFTPSTSSSPLIGFAELPKMALPLHCRPGFTAIWRMTNNYDINTTYSCMYTPGRRIFISIHGDFDNECIPKRISTFKFLVDFLSLHSEALFGYSRKFSPLFWKILHSVFYGIFYAISVTMITYIVCAFNYKVMDDKHDKTIDVLYFKARLQLTLLIVSLMVGAIWFGSQSNDMYSDMQFFIEVASDSFVSPKQSELAKGGHS